MGAGREKSKNKRRDVRDGKESWLPPTHLNRYWSINLPSPLNLPSFLTWLAGGGSWWRQWCWFWLCYYQLRVLLYYYTDGGRRLEHFNQIASWLDVLSSFWWLVLSTFYAPYFYTFYALLYESTLDHQPRIQAIQINTFLQQIHCFTFAQSNRISPNFSPTLLRKLLKICYYTTRAKVKDERVKKSHRDPKFLYHCLLQ